MKLTAFIIVTFLSFTSFGQNCQRLLKKGLNFGNIAHDMKQLGYNNWAGAQEHVLDNRWESALSDNELGTTMILKSIRSYNKSIVYLEEVIYSCPSPWRSQANRILPVGKKGLSDALELEEALDFQNEGILLALGLEKEMKNYVCQAYTKCWDGRTIYCRTFGQACTFEHVNGRYVHCTGHNQLGQWVNVWQTCQ